MMINLISPENKKKFGIYGIRNIITDKYYVGQTSETFQKRFNRHSNNLEKNRHHNEHLQRSYNKYGPDAFEFFVIKVCEDINSLDTLEESYIAEYRSKYDCYNILSGGPVMAKENNPMYGRHLSEEHKKKLSISHVGLFAGEKNNFYGADHSGKNNGFYGKHHSLEARKKMSEAKSKLYAKENNPFYGKHHTPEARAKMQNNGKHAQRKVMCVETGVIYDSIKEAAKQTNTSAKSISAVCCGSRKMANNLHWKHISKRGQYSPDGSMDDSG